eukprot:gnl/MRDRNA2_/MRDRNA2_385379_c0_seq1.p1 gnl/MRDRNA2_/MRDRNA2_385379_c0~~gnl/MRDRNA2_/MRDRNA2_385379_c0_seq1.p1  ORF type:complete len:176 (+),score=29.46 gnl/MRDRNA2_/MRDRNA2_385379_c0_seq1:225-752(+)
MPPISNCLDRFLQEHEDEYEELQPPHELLPALLYSHRVIVKRAPVIPIHCSIDPINNFKRYYLGFGPPSSESGSVSGLFGQLDFEHLFGSQSASESSAGFENLIERLTDKSEINEQNKSGSPEIKPFWYGSALSVLETETSESIDHLLDIVIDSGDRHEGNCFTNNGDTSKMDWL